MNNLVKVETLQVGTAFINPEHVVAISTETSNKFTGAVKCTRVSLINGDIIRSPWTCARVIAAIMQVVYDPSSDPDVIKTAAPAEENDDPTVKGIIKTCLLRMQASGPKNVLDAGKRLFSRYGNYVRMSLSNRLRADLHIDNYCTGLETKVGVTLDLVDLSDFRPSVTIARYGQSCRKDKDFELPTEYPFYHFEEGELPNLIDFVRRLSEAAAN